MGIIAIVGNPPYQSSSNHNRLYPYFYLGSIRIADNVVLIFPSAWQQPKNTNKLKMINTKEVKEDKRIVFIKNFLDVFRNVTGAKNVNVVFWKRGFDNGYDGKQLIHDVNGTKSLKKLAITIDKIEKPEIITDIANKVMKKEFKPIKHMITSNKPYGINSDVFNNVKKNGIVLFPERFNVNDVCLYGLKERQRVSFFISRDALPKISVNLDTYKIFIPKAWGGKDPEKGWIGGSYSSVIIARPGDCCSETYLEFGPFATLNEAEAGCAYIHTKFFRALFAYNKHSHNTPKSTYANIPSQDFTSNSDIDWARSISEIDQQLYKKYSLSKEEKSYIEDNVRKTN